MAQTPNIINSIIKCKCPKCRKGDLFINKRAFQYKNFLEVHNNCSLCNQDFQIETGFYLGAMFVNYALTIAISVAIFVAFVVLDLYSIVPFLITLGISLIITTPFILRISRSIWIAMTVKYSPNAIKNHAKQNNSK